MQQTLFENATANYNTPLAYIGAKKKLFPLFTKYLPAGITEIVSPFIGGASLELLCTARGIKVKGYDNFDLLVNFWQVFFEDTEQLCERTTDLFPISDEQFLFHIDTGLTTITNKLERVALFWCINKQSWSSKMFATRSCKSEEQIGHTPGYFRKWSDWRNQNIKIEQQDCFVTIKKNNGTFLYLDPPYVEHGDSQYGTRAQKQVFDHKKLYEYLGSTDSPWILSYDRHELIYKMYDKYEIIEPEWTYHFNKSAKLKPNELLILNI